VNQNTDDVFRAQYESEQRDRALIRQELERGVPDDEIEEEIARNSDFARLNPGGDIRAYARHLIEEENTATSLDLASMGQGRKDLKREFGSKSRAHEIEDDSPSPSPPTSIPSERTRAAEESVRSYIQENFKPDDWLAVVALNRQSGEVVQRISPAQNIASPDYQRWLRHLNAAGSDVYLSLNTFQEHARGRTKADLKEVRHLYLDLDQDGARKLEAIRHDSAIPLPNYVLNTSPGKYQVIWRVEGFGQVQAEAALRTLAQRFGGDPAATDSTRIFRLPGFNSKKYEKDFQVTMAREAPLDQVYRPEQFAVRSDDPERMPSASAAAQRRAAGEPQSQSERDWSYAIRKLQAGEDPQKIIQDMGSYRSQDRSDRTGNVVPAKAQPHYYAEHTVRKVMAHLGMKPPDQPAMREPDVQPNR
jgi:hypothetical protein